MEPLTSDVLVVEDPLGLGIVLVLDQKPGPPLIAPYIEAYIVCVGDAYFAETFGR